jgi:2-polyprenyl-3-methyl-5-hydroxy-6-metoxy-1,4-benzoquinol methylase
MSASSHPLPAFIHSICLKSPLQKKMFQSFMATRDDVYWQRLRVFDEQYVSYLARRGVDAEMLAKSYLTLCENMLREQIQFKKTGHYSSSSLEETNQAIYSQADRMSALLYGLGASQFLWPNHYGLFDFFVTQIGRLRPVDSYLEIGPGHGLFLLEVLRLFPKVNATVLDISPTAIEISQGAVQQLLPQAQCQFVIQDVTTMHQAGAYDLITMCEVLEHLDNPVPILKKAHSLLSKTGHCYITTCANAPAIDHVYLYDSVESIQTQLRSCGFNIDAELALPVGPTPRERWALDKTEINYAALLSKRNG